MSGNYRPVAAVLLLNDNNDVFIGKSTHTNKWQCIQGGIDNGESARAAAFREMYEEAGIKASRVIVVTESAKWYTYSSGPFEMDGQQYDGQKMKWFLMRYTGSDQEINIAQDSHDQEFSQFKWENYDTVPMLAPKSKHAVYASVFAEFKPMLPQSGQPIEGRAIDSSER